MTRAKQQKTETQTKELSEEQLRQVQGGIIAIMPQRAVMGDGSVKPAAPQAEKALIGLL
jgi:bacteriocin-like protein